MKHIKTHKIFESGLETYEPVKAVTDESGHWYLIPNEIYSDFIRDLNDESMEDEFGSIYGEYMTGGDLNLVQLYIKKH